MKRHTIAPRAAWQEKVDALGLFYHTAPDGKPYWDESAYYAFTPEQVEELEAAANELQRLCLLAAEHVITQERWADLCIPPEVVPWIRDAWEMEPPAIYGRFDLAYDGRSAPKMLEYNADTPTSLLEAAVVQWYWLEDRFPDADQFNSLHERLVDKWRDIRPAIREDLHFAHADDTEDVMTVTYLRDTAEQAGIRTVGVQMADLGWDQARCRFVDMENRPVHALFKLYPWEWLLHEPFGVHAIEARGRMIWIEPVWKMLWSNKGLLPILWELFPGHPNLLECYFDHPGALTAYARKPLFSREGANIQLVTPDGVWETGGVYGDEGVVYQALAPIPNCGGNFPVLGAWMIDGTCAGMGIRESSGPITDNLSRFVPHLIR